MRCLKQFLFLCWLDLTYIFFIMNWIHIIILISLRCLKINIFLCRFDQTWEIPIMIWICIIILISSWCLQRNIFLCWFDQTEIFLYSLESWTYVDNLVMSKEISLLMLIWSDLGTSNTVVILLYLLQMKIKDISLL